MITLTTDFGYMDHYVAAMKAAILKINPDARIIDITHGIRRHDVRHASYVLYAILNEFPEAVHVFVVDPGVGTGRKSIAVKFENGWFVGPDNGIITPVKDKIVKVYEINIEPKSTTFHGRDVFAPAGAYIDMGDLSCLKPIANVVTYPFTAPEKDGNIIRGEIFHIDHFGNVVTNIPEKLVSKPEKIRLGDRILRFVKSYGYAAKNELVALINSENFLEFAVNQGAASEKLNLRPGDKIEIEIL